VKNKLTTRGVAHFGAVQELPCPSPGRGGKVAGSAGQDMIGQRRRTGQRGVAAEERAGPGGGWRCRQGELGRVAELQGRWPGDCVD
jgi:hypothetical protein